MEIIGGAVIINRSPDLVSIHSSTDFCLHVYEPVITAYQQIVAANQVRRSDGRGFLPVPVLQPKIVAAIGLQQQLKSQPRRLEVPVVQTPLLQTLLQDCIVSMTPREPIQTSLLDGTAPAGGMLLPNLSRQRNRQLVAMHSLVKRLGVLNK